jgi:small subunit ribosomal protein S6
MNAKRQYELVYVMSPQASEQDVTDLHEQIEGIVSRFDAQLTKTENWGRRKLAYEIGGHKEGTYVLEVIEGAGDVIKEIDRRLKVNEQVLRHMTTRVDEDLRAAELTRARRATEAERRAERRPQGAAPVQAEPAEATGPKDETGAAEQDREPRGAEEPEA